MPDAPAELKEWGQQTGIGLYFGLLVGGSRQYFRDRSAGKWVVKHTCIAAVVCATVYPVGSWQPPPDATLNKAALARLQAEENSRRLVRIANETLKYASILVCSILVNAQCCNASLLGARISHD